MTKHQRRRILDIVDELGKIGVPREMLKPIVAWLKHLTMN